MRCILDASPIVNRQLLQTWGFFTGQQILTFSSVILVIVVSRANPLRKNKCVGGGGGGGGAATRYGATGQPDSVYKLKYLFVITTSVITKLMHCLTFDVYLSSHQRDSENLTW